ncbi:MAG: putative cytochrome [Frankiales bacterium]|nr:putative cytochrome [Frankiales bacterium]
MTELLLADLPMSTDREAAWQVLRDLGPVVLIEDAYYVTSDAGIEAVLHDPQLFSSKLAFDVLGSPVPLVPLAFDPPEHMRYRRMLAPFFSPGVIARLYDGLREQVATIIDPLAKAGSCEVVNDLCVPFPSQVFLTLMGLPLEDTDRLVHWKTAVIAATSPSGATNDDMTAALELFTYLTESIATRRGATDDSLWTKVINDDSGDALSDEELLGLGFLLVLAGLDTVTSTLSIAFERLANDPTEQARLAAEPSLIPEFVEELVRLDPVATFTPRMTSRATTLEGTEIPAGARVVMVFAAANRETHERHWGFGGGVHRCLGSHLARAELKLVLEEWLARVPEFRYSPGFTPQMEWPISLLGFDRLELSYSPS